MNYIKKLDKPSKYERQTTYSEPIVHDKNTTNLSPGEFLYIEDLNERIMIQTAWKAVVELNMSDFIKNVKDNFLYNQSKELRILYDKIEENGYTGHSGSSFATTMRTLKYILVNGEQKFITLRNFSKS